MTVDKEAGTFTIKASHRDSSHADTVEAGWRVHRRERSETFSVRTLALPSNVKRDAIAVELNNGVLHIKMPKETQTTKPVRIAIA